MSIEEIITNAENGRGLWIGMPVSGIPKEFETYFEDPHVTLVHLGRKNDGARVTSAWLAAVDTLKKLNLSSHAFRLEMTGVGFLSRGAGTLPTPVMLINSAAMCSIRATLADTLRDHGVIVDDYFGFIPHVTIKQREDYSPLTTFTRFVNQKFFAMSRGVEMYCGDSSLLITQLGVF